MSDTSLLVQAACIWEASARKAGNVHPFRDFADASYLDFVLSAAAIAPVLGMADGQRVGRTILDAVKATRQVTRSNTNLGIILLLAPLAAVPQHQELSRGVEDILGGLDVEDARLTYEAIRLAAPGGLGHVDDQDVFAEPTLGLRQVMALAAERDLVARQYADGFRDVFEWGFPSIRDGLGSGSLERAVIGCHLRCLAGRPDSLIARKCGDAAARDCQARTAAVIAAGWPNNRESLQLFRELDNWLRQDGNRRNPGASADFVTACLYVALRLGVLRFPLNVGW